MRTIVIRWVQVFPLVAALLVSGLTSQLAVADIIATETVLAEQAGSVDRDQLQSLLDREDVQAKLIEYGVSVDEAKERVAALTQSELQQLSEHMDDEPAGGSVTLILLIIVLILLLR